ncbi:hypothetical protein H072_10972 [Dactylellina haptotyla CBS 200.50]|uniref:Uncharacterized protein n=1 Tax=Dactylellina haptotyla (strain CBS 200.50) TaxID=1284197 RepID=S8A383_DACHA|nr:hypothetical protein H072_10972 [Dactylellina haptotyla CBS 200.50]
MDFLAPRTVDQNAVGPPFGARGLHGGAWYMANHTSTISFAYERETILTPWPWLLFSFGVSFLTAGWGYFSTLKQRHEETKGERLRAKITIAILLLTTVRSVATLILAIKSYTNPLRYPPPSAIAALFISALSSALDCGLLPGRFYGAVLKRVAQIDALVTCAAMVMMFAIPFAKGSFLYGRYTYAGGHCPITVTNRPYKPTVVGCPSNYTVLSAKERAEFWGGVPRVIDDLNASYTSASEIALVVLAVVVGGYITVSGFRLIGWTRETIEYIWNYKEESERKKGRELESNSEELYFVGSLKREKPKAPVRRDASAFILLSILMFAAVSVPIHAVQQNRPKLWKVLDGFGPPDKPKKTSDGPTFRGEFDKFPGENANGTSWVDCYDVGPPTSTDGFMRAWIDVQKKDPLTFLAMI